MAGDGNTRTLQGVRDSIWDGEDLTVATCPLLSAGAGMGSISCSLNIQLPFHLGCSALGRKTQAGAETAAVHMMASVEVSQTPGTEL